MDDFKARFYDRYQSARGLTIDLERRTSEIAEAAARNEIIGLTARLPGQTEWSLLSMNPAQLAWWSLGEEAGFSLSG